MKRIIVLLLACLSVGTIASAANSTATEVQIAIEASEEMAVGDGNNSQRTRQTESVQTGDEENVLGYLCAAVVAVGFGFFCIFKKRKGMLAVLALFLSLLFMNNSVYAAEGTKNVNVTIPSSISVSFDETGENSISEFGIVNQSLVPITIGKVNVEECNDWKLCDEDEDIQANTKKMMFSFEGQCLQANENALDIAITENSSRDCNIHINRGAWTASQEAETALKLEFEYEIGRKEFQLTFDSNGGNQSIEPQKVYNGDVVTLPKIVRDKYAFVGWEDSDGNLYTDQYVMPIGDVTLNAKWKEKVAYAIHIASDSSLRFVRSAEPIVVGDTYDGKAVTGVYTGFETASYSSEYQVPWYDGDYYNQTIVKKVIAEDVIQPISTAHWFHWMYDCESIDLRKLDTSKVTDMSYMFAWAGFWSTDFELKGADDFDVSNVTNMTHTFGAMARDAKTVVIDLSRWNVSKVTNMHEMFDGAGYFSTTFGLGDLSGWDVSNVTDMTNMFRQTGYYADWYVNCSSWDVRKVTANRNFCLEVASEVIEPEWLF